MQAARGREGCRVRGWDLQGCSTGGSALPCVEASGPHTA
jgi:hypothetical protein